MAVNLLIYELDHLKVNTDPATEDSIYNLANRIKCKDIADETGCQVLLVSNLRLLKHEQIEVHILLSCPPQGMCEAAVGFDIIDGTEFDNIIIVARRVNALAECYFNGRYKIYTNNIIRYHNKKMPNKRPDSLLRALYDTYNRTTQYKKIIDDLFLLNNELFDLVGSYFVRPNVPEALEDYERDFIEEANRLLAERGITNDEVYDEYIMFLLQLRTDALFFKEAVKTFGHAKQDMDYEDVYVLVKQLAKHNKLKTRRYDSSNVVKAIYDYVVIK